MLTAWDREVCRWASKAPPTSLPFRIPFRTPSRFWAAVDAAVLRMTQVPVSAAVTPTDPGRTAAPAMSEMPADGSLCAICLEALPRPTAPTLACGHAFHRDCIRRWMRHTNAASVPCPVCRRPMMGC